MNVIAETLVNPELREELRATFHHVSYSDAVKLIREVLMRVARTKRVSASDRRIFEGVLAYCLSMGWDVSAEVEELSGRPKNPFWTM